MTSLRKFVPSGIVCFTLCVSICLGAKLPDDWIRCSLKAPDSSECFRKAVEDAITKLKDGAPEVGLSSLDPLLIPSMTIGAGSGPVNVVQHFTDIKLHGLTGSKVLSVEPDIDHNALYAKSVTPFLRLEANYDMNGRILLLPITGNGPCNITLINTAINHTLTGERIQKKGKEFIHFTNYSVTLYPDKVTFKLDNLFNGDERLGKEINRILNENQDAVFGDVRNGYEQSFGLIFQDLANRVFTRVGIKDIFLDL